METSVFDDLTALIGSDYDFLVVFVACVIVSMLMIFVFNFFSFLFKWIGGIR